MPTVSASQQATMISTLNINYPPIGVMSSASAAAALSERYRTSTRMPLPTLNYVPPPPAANIRRSTPVVSAPVQASSSTSQLPPQQTLLSVPPQSISHLREALESLDLKMASLVTERQMLKTRLEQAVRSQSPISRLPSELLGSIFMLGVSNVPDDEEPLILSTLMLVCRHWATVALDTAALWSTITISTQESIRRAKQQFTLSKSVPLDVTIDFTAYHDQRTPIMEVLTHSMDLLRPALWRTRSLRLSVPSVAQANVALTRCQDDAPTLEVLSICVLHSLQQDPPRKNPLAPTLFNGNTPRLRECVFTSLDFGWAVGQPIRTEVLHGLKVLRLGGYWNSHAPSVDTLLGILRACPDLEELALRNMTDIDPECEDSQGSSSAPIAFAKKTIHLPRLTKASFHCAGGRRTRALLSHILFPALERLDLCYLEDVTPVLNLLTEQSLTSLPLQTLKIESGFLNELPLVSLLQRVNGLKTLEVVDMEDVTGNLIRAMSAPSPGNPWVCPQLEKLGLDGCTNIPWEALHKLVESRHRSNRRLHAIDVTRCHQITKEGMQWLRTYVPRVSSDKAKGVWGESVMH